MELLDQIKQDRMEARRAKDTIATPLLTALVGEAETALKGKQAAKFDMQKLVRKFANNLEELLAIKSTTVGKLELQILESYLPKQLTASQIEGIIRLQSESTLGKFMGYMNKAYKGQFDGKVASDLFKQVNS